MRLRRLATFRQQTEAWHSESVFYTTSKIQSLGMPESKFLRGIESKSEFFYDALPLILSEVPPCVQNPSYLAFPPGINPFGSAHSGGDMSFDKPLQQKKTTKGMSPKSCWGRLVTQSSGFSKRLILQGEEHSQVSMDLYWLKGRCSPQNYTQAEQAVIAENN